MNNQPKIPTTKWAWRLLRWGLMGLAVLITLLVALVTEENWRGKRAWENYKRQSAARGEPLDTMALSPANIPDEQNFTKAPIFSAWAAMAWDERGMEWKLPTNMVDRLKMQTTRSDGTWPTNGSGDWNRARLTDLKPWQNYYRNPPANSAGEFPIAQSPQSAAADVLLALSKYDSAIEELRLASQRPYSRFLGNYANDPRALSKLLMYLGEFKSCFSVIQLRALAELADGQSSRALDDITLLLRLNETVRQEPLLIAQLVSISTMSISLQAIYEGLAQHKWSDEQLAELQKQIGKKDFLADYQKAMRGERAFSIESLENMRRTHQWPTLDNTSGSNTVKMINLYWPKAMFYQNELTFARLHEKFTLPLIDSEKHRASPSAVLRADAAMQAEMKHYNPYKVLALVTFPALGKGAMRFARIQSGVDLAELACALERYRLAHANYPETLDALAPQFIAKLPPDLINGQPLHYRRTNEGQFVLYSVGWNEVDDGGQVALAGGGGVDPDKGDWVWQYPTQ
jgi:hypothetical protein